MVKIVLSKEERRLRDSQMRVSNISLAKINDNPYQPRKKYPKKYIKELAKSISDRGLLHPIAVVSVNGNYVVVGGHCRLRAFRFLRRQTIPAIIRRQSSQKDLALDLAVENALRKDFTPYEKAQAVFTVLKTIDAVNNDILRAYSLVTQVKLMSKRGAESIHNKKGNSVGMSTADVHKCGRLLKLLGMSENTALKYLRLLNLPGSIAEKVVAISSNESLSKRMIRQGYITVTMGYELSRVKSNKSRVALYKKAVSEHWNAITLRHVVDELIETGTEGQVNKLGSSKRRGEEDYGMDSLTKSCFRLGNRIWNFRKQLQVISFSLDKVTFRASLVKLRKACIELAGRIDAILGKDGSLTERQDVENESFEVTIRPGAKQRFRFTFPGKQGQRLGLEPGDKVVFKIETIKKQVEVT